MVTATVVHMIMDIHHPMHHLFTLHLELKYIQDHHMGMAAINTVDPEFTVHIMAVDTDTVTEVAMLVVLA